MRTIKKVDIKTNMGRTVTLRIMKRGKDFILTMDSTNLQDGYWDLPLDPGTKTISNYNKEFDIYDVIEKSDIDKIFDEIQYPIMGRQIGTCRAGGKSFFIARG